MFPRTEIQSLLSPAYHTRTDRDWYLIRWAFAKTPQWVVDAGAPRTWAIFREIAYVGAEGTIEGVGRSWTPPTRIGLRLIRACANPLRPRPLGVAVMELSGGRYLVEVLGCDRVAAGERSPYLAHAPDIERCRRSIRVGGEPRPVTYVEEEYAS